MLRSLIPWRESPPAPSTDRFSRLMNRMEGEMESLFGKFWSDEEVWHADFTPTTDLVETEKQFEVTVDLPGLKPEEVDVELKNGDLWISGKREEETEEKGKTRHRIERRCGEFCRVLPLPSTIKEGKIVAKFENGVLMVTVPKSAEARTKHIEVTT